MEFSERQLELLEHVKIWHGDQVRKYTGEPYWTHLVSVAKIAAKHITDPADSLMVVEIALCHDVLEDTKCTKEGLLDTLMKLGYERLSALIVMGVDDLTDKFTPATTPQGNRKYRKYKEALRLSKTSELIQSIKYADLIDNTKSIVENDNGFAKVYLEEKKELLKKMRDGNFDLYIEACWTLKDSLNKLV